MLAKGPNTLNLANYAQAQGQQVVYDPKQFAEIVEAESPDLEQLFDNCIKDIQKYDEVLAKVAKSINQISAEQHFITDFYPEFALKTTYQSDQQHKVIAQHDIQLSKVMQNLQKSNRILKQEYKGWLFEYAKKTRLTQVLITENKLLRKYISSKNKDIIKLVKAITKADNQELNQLNQSLEELKQQNGLLLDHLKEIQGKLRDRADEESKVVQAYRKAEREKLDLEAKIKEGEDEQQHYSKMVTLLQSSIQDLTHREKSLQSQKSHLLHLQSEYKQDQNEIDEQIQQCKINRQDLDKHLKQKFKTHQSQKQLLMNQIQDLTQKIKRIKQQSKIIQDDIARNQGKIGQYRGRGEEYDSKIEELERNVEGVVEEEKKYKELEIQQLTGIDVLNFDIQLIKTQLQNLEHQQQTLKQTHTNQLKSLQSQKSVQLATLTKKYNNIQSQLNQKLFEKKSNIQIKRREAQEMQKKIKDKKKQIEELKQQLIQIKQNQVYYVELKEKMRDIGGNKGMGTG